jgi:SAM-dependent methyltransferase
MPVMSAVERALCRSGPWRSFTRRVALPWVLAGAELDGEVLELGSGSGSIGEELLVRFPSIRLTATDVDPAMLETARQRLRSFGDRVEVRQADATGLPFPDGRFDAVVSFIMLHHTIRWEQVLGEAVRVLRPGGVLVGYDLVKSGPARAFHRLDRSHHRLATGDELSARLAGLPLDDLRVEPALRRLVVRFHGHRVGENDSAAPPTQEEETP